MGGVSGHGPSSCHEEQGAHFCTDTPPHISNVACTGTEQDILSCPAETGDDVFCAPDESVVLRCAGDGDTTGLHSHGIPAPTVASVSPHTFVACCLRPSRPPCPADARSFL